jgi:hypothetical protein
MSSRPSSPQQAPVLWGIPTALIAAAAIACLTGWPVLALILLVLGITATVVVGDTIGRPNGLPLCLEPDLAAEIRAERDEDGELAAIKLLRTRKPDLTLADAVRLVRDL